MWVYTADELYTRSPSVVADGVSVVEAEVARQVGAFIVDAMAGRVVSADGREAAAMVALQIMHRVWARASIRSIDTMELAAVALGLAGKLLGATTLAMDGCAREVVSCRVAWSLPALPGKPGASDTEVRRV